MNVRLSTFVCALSVVPCAIVAEPGFLSYFLAIPTTVGLVFLARWLAEQEGKSE